MTTYSLTKGNGCGWCVLVVLVSIGLLSFTLSLGTHLVWARVLA